MRGHGTCLAFRSGCLGASCFSSFPRCFSLRAAGARRAVKGTPVALVDSSRARRSRGGRRMGNVSGNGGAMGTECRTSGDCPLTDCYMCPTRSCVNGRCVAESTGSTGGVGGAGSSGDSKDSGVESGATKHNVTVFACGNTTCHDGELCVEQRCGGAPSSIPCSPPPRYCAAIPDTCTAPPSATSGCSCANSVCRWGTCHAFSETMVMCDSQ